MPVQPPVFGGARAAKRKPWERAAGAVDRRKRGRQGCRDREQVRREEPLCRHCLAEGRTSATTVIDHIIRLADGGSDVRANKQGLCDDCHAAKSAAEQALDRGAGSDLWAE